MSTVPAENPEFLLHAQTGLLDDHPLPTWIIDAGTLNICYSNKSSVLHYGFTAEEFYGKKFTDLFNSASAQELLSRSVQNKVININGTYQQLKKNCNVVEVEIFSNRFSWENKDYYQVTAVDITAKEIIQNNTEEDSHIELKDNQELQQTTNILSRLVEQTSDILTAADLEFKPVTWNKASELIYGLSAEQAIGKDLRQYLNIQYQNATRDQVRKVIIQKGEWKGEVFFVRPTDNKLVTLIITFKLRLNEQNHPIGYLISGTDITDRKNAELILKETENRFRDLSDSAPVMIWISDKEEKIYYVNKPWVNFTGVDLLHIKDKGWMDLLHKDDVSRVRQIFNKHFAERLPVTIVYRLKHKEGYYRWVQENGIPRILGNGNFLGYIGSVIDIHDQKIKEEQLSYQGTILENVSDIIFTTDLDLRIQTINKVATDYHEITLPAVYGKKLTDIISYNFLNSGIEEISLELLRSGKWQGEASVMVYGGEKKYFHTTFKYVFDKNGDKIGILCVSRDITERKIIERKVQQSEKFYRTLISDSLNGTLLLDEEGKLTFSSPSVRHILGFEAEEIIGRSGFEFVHPDDLARAFDSFQKEVSENPEVKFIVVRLLRKDGGWTWCMVRGHNMLKNPDIKSIVVYFHDDTLRKQANDALRESEKRFRNLILDLQIGILVQDKNGITTMCNEAICKILLSTEQEMLNRSIYEIATDAIQENGKTFEMKDRPTFKSVNKKSYEKDVVIGIYRPKLKDRVWLIINSNPILDDNGEILHIICSIKDITERKKLEKELVRKQINHQKQLTQATIDGQEKERREIGKELHDNIGQQLTTVKLFLEMANGTENAANEMLSMALKGVSDLINEVRSISSSLVPSTLNDLGLVDSINELFKNSQEARLLKIILLHDNFNEDILRENQKLTLFRIVQEQLNNIVVHAEAKEVIIILQMNARHIILEIKDDGKGFNIDRNSKGLGLINIKNRVELFGGTAEITSQPKKGCVLKIFLPLNMPQLIENQ